MTRGLFLDRDGTVIEECGYLADPSLVRALPGAAEALAALAIEGWKLIVVSNQSGVGRGLIAPDQMEAVQRRFLDLMRSHGVPIADSYICIHTPEDRCQCRKPSPFLLRRAAVEHGLDLSASYMIGDREGDIVCGQRRRLFHHMAAKRDVSGTLRISPPLSRTTGPKSVRYSHSNSSRRRAGFPRSHDRQQFGRNHFRIAITVDPVVIRPAVKIHQRRAREIELDQPSHNHRFGVVLALQQNSPILFATRPRATTGATSD